MFLIVRFLSVNPEFSVSGGFGDYCSERSCKEMMMQFTRTFEVYIYALEKTKKLTILCRLETVFYI